MSSKVLAVIPARAQSKRIPGKNKKLFLGKPLIHWSIDAALKSKSITDVIVTTDDEEILGYQSHYPTVKFFRRPAELALDATPGVDPVLHLMGQLKQPYNYLVLLQPTSPLRNSAHIDAAFEKLLNGATKQIVSVKKMVDAVDHIVFKSQGGIQFFKKHLTNLPTDCDLKVLNGAIYISEWETLLTEKTFLGKNIDLFEMDELDSVDIDHPEDWKRAERLAKMKAL